MISISYLKPLREACNITSANYVTSEREYLRNSACKIVKTFVGVTITFTKVIPKLSRRYLPNAGYNHKKIPQLTSSCG